jgi:hypothetical protein
VAILLPGGDEHIARAGPRLATRAATESALADVLAGLLQAIRSTRERSRTSSWLLVLGSSAMTAASVAQTTAST